MDTDLRIGVITSSHGLKGEVKIYPTSDDPERFDHLEHVRVRMPGGDQTLQIASVRYFKKFVIARFTGLDRIEDIQPLLHKDLYISREEAGPLAEDEYYIADLIGLEAFSEDERRLGVIDDVLQTGTHDVYVIRGDTGEILVPAVHEFIREIDVAAGRLVIRLIPGMDGHDTPAGK